MRHRICGAGACKVVCASDGDCIPPFTCQGTGTKSCALKKNGLACSAGNQCISGNCVVAGTSGAAAVIGIGFWSMAASNCLPASIDRAGDKAGCSPGLIDAGSASVARATTFLPDTAP